MEKRPTQILVELYIKIKSGNYTQEDKLKYILYKDAIEQERGKDFVDMLLTKKG